MQVPGEHRDVYISTTLSIVVFTTVVFGGLTEPVLTRMGMRLPYGRDSSAGQQYEAREEILFSSLVHYQINIIKLLLWFFCVLCCSWLQLPMTQLPPMTHLCALHELRYSTVLTLRLWIPFLEGQQNTSTMYALHNIGHPCVLHRDFNFDFNILFLTIIF